MTLVVAKARMPRLAVIVGTIGLAASGLAACTPAAPCLPSPLTASPTDIAPGETVTVSSGPAECDLGYVDNTTYTIALFSSTSQTSEPIEVPVDDDGTFSAEIRVPETFSSGIASVTVSGSPYDDCGDESGSCAVYSVDVTITP